MTVDDYLRAWLDRQRTQLAPSTHAAYGATIRRYVSPALGDRELDALDPLTVEQVYTRLHDCGGADGAPLAVGTVRYIHAVLHKALADAVRLRMLDVNVTDFVQLPRGRGADEATPKLRTWTVAQAQAFLRHTAGDRLQPLWATALGTGMRRGELLALAWDDVDLADRTVRVQRSLTTVDGRPVRKQTKTGRPRTLSIDVGLAERLARLRGEQSVSRSTVDWKPVFTDAHGAPHVPMRITTTFRRLVRRLPVPTIRLHDLRHTHASLLIQAGVSIKVVSERLGHRTIALTMDTYTHVLPAVDRDAVDRLADLLNGAGRR